MLSLSYRANKDPCYIKPQCGENVLWMKGCHVHSFKRICIWGGIILWLCALDWTWSFSIWEYLHVSLQTLSLGWLVSLCVSLERCVFVCGCGCECEFRFLWMHNFVEAVLLYVFIYVQMCFCLYDEPRQDGAVFFPFFFWTACGRGVYCPHLCVCVCVCVCVMRSENALYLMADRCQAGYFRFTVWVAAVRMSQTDRGEGRREGGWEIKRMYPLPQSHMKLLLASCLFFSSGFLKTINVAAPLTKILLGGISGSSLIIITWLVSVCTSSCDCELH